MKDHVVEYPGSIKKRFIRIDKIKNAKVRAMLLKANLPKRSLIDIISGPEHMFFIIILPDGMSFVGMAFRKRDDDYDFNQGAITAAGRALACVKEYFKLKEKGLHTKFYGGDSKAFKIVSPEPFIPQHLRFDIK